MLEPYEGKLSCTVLRGEGGSNIADLLDRPRDIEQREGRILRQGNTNEEVEIFVYVTKGSYDANMWEKIKNKAMIIAQAMSNNLVQRRIEDMDAAVLSYAEAEALASGNPLMAEKTMVDAEVIKYGMLQGEYQKRQRENERRLRQLPEVMQSIKNVIEKLEKDIKHRIPILSGHFRMKIHDKIYAKRPEASEALEAAIEELKPLQDTKVGEIAGFNININKGIGFVDTVMTLTGNYVYTVNHSLRSIENCAMNMPEKILSSRLEKLHVVQKEMDDLREILKRPFEDQEKLEGLLARQKEIDLKIESLTENIDHRKDMISVDQISKNDPPEEIYQAYANKLKIHQSTNADEKFDQKIAYAMNDAGYSERKIKECLAWSINLKDLASANKIQKINHIMRNLNTEIQSQKR